MKKMLGLTCGSRMGNSEILIKEALMEAEKSGASVELIRMLDLDIKPCKACGIYCAALKKGPEGCVCKDDGPFLYHKIMDCDALIISAPVYTKTPPAYLRVLGDRLFGPKADVSFKIEQKKMKEAGVKGPLAEMFLDERAFKNRVGGFISVGGAISLDWVSLGLPILHTMTFSLRVAIVDQIQIMGAAMPGTVLLNDQAMQRAGILGRNVAEQMGRNFEDVEYRGDSPGTCPVCHLDMIIMRDSFVECALCGIHGHIKMDGDKPIVIFPEEEQKKSVLEIEGLKIHGDEIMNVAKATEPRTGEIPPKLKKYEAYNPLIKPPRREKTQ